MTAVIDASVVVAALANTRDLGAWCERQLAQHDLSAPHLMPAEVTSSLRRRVAHGDLTAQAAAPMLEDLASVSITLYPFEPFAERVWELQGSLTAYDAWYVAVAEALEVPMMTLDRRLVGAPGPRCTFRTPD